jgi:hypothetical protein
MDKMVKKKKKKQGQREEEKSRLFPIFVCGFQNHLCSITCWTYIKLVICCALNRTINQCWLAVAVVVVNSRFGFGHGIHARAETHKYRYFILTFITRQVSERSSFLFFSKIF